MNFILDEDLKEIYGNISENLEKFTNSNILITGCCGFLGYYFLNFFNRYKKNLGIKTIVAIDNFQIGKPCWLEELLKEGNIDFYRFDIVKDSLQKLKIDKSNSFVIHMASIASPSFYRKYPIKTIEANVWGLKNLLDEYKSERLRGFLFFSSSEIYGDPLESDIPTPETYRGNVNTIGPRACYDESKRLGETLCYEYSKEYGMPISVVRPFNNYGPGIKLDDKRVSEISIFKLAEIYKEKAKILFNYTGNICYEKSNEKNYLTDCPKRRCPMITKAVEKLRYNPKIYIEDGVDRFLRYIKQEGEKK